MGGARPLRASIPKGCAGSEPVANAEELRSVPVHTGNLALAWHPALVGSPCEGAQGMLNQPTPEFHTLILRRESFLSMSQFRNTILGVPCC